MNKYEEILKVLDELTFKLHRKHWSDIKVLEEMDAKYSQAVEKAIEVIKRLEDLDRLFKEKL